MGKRKGERALARLRLKPALASLLSAALVCAAMTPAALAAEPTATMTSTSGSTVDTQFNLLLDEQQISVTAPTEVNLYLNADGTFTCPDTAYIENESDFDIMVESWSVADGNASALTGKSKADYDASTDTTTPMYYLTATANADAATAADIAVADSPTGWEMTATDNTAEGANKGTGDDCLALAFVGAAKNFDISNFTTKQTLSNVTWTFKAVEKETVAYALILDNSAAAAAEVSLLAEGDATSYVGTTPMVFMRSETAPTVGGKYDGLPITAVYSGFETLAAETSSDVPWYADGNCANVTSVTFADTVRPRSATCWFFEMSKCTSMDLAKLDTSLVTDMSNMFSRCSNLTELDVSGFDTSSVTDMTTMFSSCVNLTELDLSSFDTSNVTSMSAMFYNCKALTELDVSNFDTKNVMYVDYIFKDCSALTLDCSGWNVSSALYYDEFNLNAPDVTPPVASWDCN